MSYAIFCPSNHLILDAPTCAECGWTRPAQSASGEQIWSVELEAELGGPGRAVLARPAAAQGMVVFPLSNGELAGLSLSDGYLRWRTALDPGLLARTLVADGRRLLASLSDVRPLEQAGRACLAAIDPLDGEIKSLWESDGHQLGDPVLSDELILVRSSRGGLIAFGRSAELPIRWQCELQAWWAQPLLLAKDRLILLDGNPMRGEGTLLVLRLSDGTLLWERPIQDAFFGSPVASERSLLIRSGRSTFEALDLDTGSLLWSHEYKRIYGAICAEPGGLFLAVRGEAGEGQEGHYQLEARDPANGWLIWAAPLPAHARVRSGPLMAEGKILVATDNGRLLSFDPGSGAAEWSLPLGSSENPPRSELLVEHGILIAGTAFGRICAVQISAPIEAPCDPQVYMDRGDLESAAAALALCGKTGDAARIYAESLNQPRNALVLYEKAGQFEAAGELAMQQGFWSQARSYFNQAGLPLKEAEALVQMGDLRSAARLFEEIGETRLAAEQYEKAGELRKALDLYEQTGDLADTARLRVLVPLTLDDVERFEHENRLIEAGEAALDIAEWGKAVDLFHRADDRPRELLALDQLARAQGEAWAWERLAALARSLGHFIQEAEACQRLELIPEAAEAYLHAAQQLENREPEKEVEIAALYEKAYTLFDDQGLEEEASQCHEQVIRHRHQPWVIVVYGQAGKAFREGEQNYLDLTVRNVGYGVAHQFMVQLDSSKFVLESTQDQVRRLAPGAQHEKKIRIYIRPQPGQVGEGVPLALTWCWKDQNNLEYSERMSWPVIVRRDSEPGGPATPMEIHYHGTVYQAQEGIEIVSGDKVGGDQVAGDQVGAGGQKGDKVVIGRSSAKPPVDRETTTQAALLCPKCSLNVSPKDRFCQICGEPLNIRG